MLVYAAGLRVGEVVRLRTRVTRRDLSRIRSPLDELMGQDEDEHS